MSEFVSKNLSEKGESVLIGRGELKREVMEGKPIYLCMPKLLCLNDVDVGTPQGLEELLASFEDVFLKELPDGLPPLRGIKHQIDFIPGAQLPNRPAYRSTPQETQEIQRQVDDLLAKG